MKLKIEGMSCNHCVNAVTQALGAVPGVDRVVEVNLERGEAEIEGSAEVALLVAAVEEEGFKAEPTG
jgi:copper chaperone